MGERENPPHVALVVEDDMEVRSLAAALIEETELDVVEAESAEEGLDYLRQHASEVALLFTDVRLPCMMDGVDLAQKVRAKWPWIRVVVTSGHGERIDELPGGARYMPKPWRALDVLIEAERAVAKAA
jgi:CheY-like chemotaxis protein